ncbi:rhodanese-like domain-containing protein [Streptomyces albus]|uniref:rhodanese-like domain-containing protein n=1 Tax=Streptomyces albus TaxID=1888 RepID=UPI0004C6A900|nr:rhodanese-like domain-containing protein [Streptomyces albus]
MNSALTPQQLRPRLDHLTVIDVRSPGEYAGGHIPGALNIPLDQLQRALPDLRAAAERGELAVVCASGARSQQACEQLTAAGVPAATLVGGTNAWAEHGHPLNQPEGGRPTWAMDRQVRLVAGSLVLTGLILGLFFPMALWLSAFVAGGLVFSALTNTCGMAVMLSKLPYNRPRGGAGLDATLAELRR